MKSPYEILGVSTNADIAEIKAAYRKLAREVHPDRHPGDKEVAERFRDINDAYRLLSNPHERRKYDEFAAMPPHERRRPPRAGAGESVHDEYSEAFARFFEAMFMDFDMGAGRHTVVNEAMEYIIAGIGLEREHIRRRQTQARARALVQDVVMSLVESLQGHKLDIDGRTVRLPRCVREHDLVRVPAKRGGVPEITLRVRIRPSAYLRWEKHMELHYAMPVSVDELMGSRDISYLCPLTLERIAVTGHPWTESGTRYFAPDVPVVRERSVSRRSTAGNLMLVRLVIRPRLLLVPGVTRELCEELRSAIARGGAASASPRVQSLMLPDPPFSG